MPRAGSWSVLTADELGRMGMDARDVASVRAIESAGGCSLSASTCDGRVLVCCSPHLPLDALRLGPGWSVLKRRTGHVDAFRSFVAAAWLRELRGAS